MDAGVAERAQAPVEPLNSMTWANIIAETNSLRPIPPVAAHLSSHGSSHDSGSARTFSQVVQQFDPQDHKDCRKIACRGLYNTGNICFMNSILQALMSCGPFRKLLEEIEKSSERDFNGKRILIDALIEFYNDYCRDVDHEGSSSSEPPPISIEALYSQVSGLSRFKHLKRGCQEDAEEFLGHLLEQLHEELDPSANSEFADTGDSSGEWKEVGKSSKPLTVRYSGDSLATPVTKIFGGQFKSVLKKDAARPSITYDPFQRIQLDIDDKHVQSISDALRLVTQREVVFDEPEARVVISKQVFLSVLPPVLVLHVKRFLFSDSGHVQKLNKPIKVDTQLVIPEDSIASSLVTQPRVYQLFALVYHHGPSATTGHYTTDVRSSCGLFWAGIDDMKVSRRGRLDESESKVPYLLFYQMI